MRLEQWSGLRLHMGVSKRSLDVHLPVSMDQFLHFLKKRNKMSKSILNFLKLVYPPPKK